MGQTLPCQRCRSMAAVPIADIVSAHGSAERGSKGDMTPLPCGRLFFAREGLRNVASTFDEALDHPAERTILQGHKGDHPWPRGQTDRQRFQRAKTCNCRIGRKVWAIGNEVIYEVHGESEQAHRWHIPTLRPEGLRHVNVIPRIRRRQNPGLLAQLGNIDCTTARPTGCAVRKQSPEDRRKDIPKFKSSSACSF